MTPKCEKVSDAQGVKQTSCHHMAREVRND
jgi:hypothetical protein